MIRQRFGSLGLLFASFLVPALAHAQFDFGSNGSFGAIHVTAGTTMTITVPPDGVIHATTVTIEGDNQQTTLNFVCNARNTPIYLLAQGDVSIKRFSRLILSGGSGTNTGGGPPGCGGFAGGAPNLGGPAGDGAGPGGGKAGSAAAGDNAGAAGFGLGGAGARGGAAYGTGLMVPLVGGSGGGGRSDQGGSGGSQLGGGGGGGAILIASNTSITIDTPYANQGYGVFALGGDGAASGSGGAIRLLAPRVVIPNTALCVAATQGGCYSTSEPGQGRIRIDAVDKTGIANANSAAFPPSALSLGTYMAVSLSPEPRLAITSAAGTAIAEGSDPVFVQLPVGSSANQNVTVLARDFSGIVPIRVAIIPDSGATVTYDSQINMAGGNPSSVVVPVVIPDNIRVQVQAWTRSN